ncbi:MAG: Fur family transcriptional regulator [bacterium]
MKVAWCLNFQRMELRRIARSRGLRLTAPRRIILDHLASAGMHSSAEKIYKDLKERHPGIGRATVFRTLNLFENAGLCEKKPRVLLKRGFEIKAGRVHHDHMVCLSCGKILEFNNPAIESLQDAETRKLGFRAVSHTLEINGYCRTCRHHAEKNEKAG